jgi:isopentenyldiphosphate isomerase
MSDLSKLSLTSDERQSNQVLLIVDEKDQVLGESTRQDIHARRLWHRQTYVIILDSNDNMLLQKRNHQKKFDPGKWTTSVSGHVLGYETYLESARWETEEELGIHLDDLKYIGTVMAYSLAPDKEICGGPSAVFWVRAHIPTKSVIIEDDEVTEVSYFHIEEIRSAINGWESILHNGAKIQFAQDFVDVFMFFWQKWITRQLNEHGGA